MEPTGETGKEKTDGSQKVPAQLLFFLLCYIVVIVKSYKVKPVAVDLQFGIFDIFFTMLLLYMKHTTHLPNHTHSFFL